MEFLFAILVLALLILGLRNRKKSKKEWVKEERYEDSGAWIDKRSGERGTYGSLDEEMEANRLYIAKQGKISELAQDVQAYCFAQIIDFQNFNDHQLKQHLAFCKSEINGLFEKVEAFVKREKVAIPDRIVANQESTQGLKKVLLDFSFERFPKLLDLEIEQIQQFDQTAAQTAQRILAEIERIRIL
jgi:hypothetical protein